ncbi:alpha/beta fold hydrolase [Paenibacillus wynnii]|uniref:alpha/beta fold hydrolase n=1 Tax=Paenibacillus wynnii TaxID=268407 RepID=UPI002792FD3E|nr:alpha/beta hydrolase [Paenibacillus wynnii]MDQ0194611.1 pimeloyl-ACP methyl ester carboxylesterase [Paenibacillus wynnii]
MQRYKNKIGKQFIYESYDTLLESWDIDFEERKIETAYGTTHVITVGNFSNPPLVLFHGTADNSAMMWVYNIKELGERFFVIAVDAIGGSGKSEPNENYYKNFNQVSWIDEILEAFDIYKTNICGVSYGAYLSYQYSLKRPDKVEKAICMAGRIPSSQFEVLSKMMFAFLPEALFPSEKNSKKLLKKLSGPNYSVFEKNEVLMKHWYYLLKYFNNKSMMQHKIEITENNEFSVLKDKTLFLIGEFDRLSNYPRAITKLEDNNIRYKIIKDAGHAINHEQAEVVNKEIINFLI